MPVKKLRVAFLFALVAAAACGRPDDLALVPSHSLLYVHVSDAVDPEVLSLVPAELSGVPEGLWKELLLEGPLGIDVVAVDLSTLRPQLVLLTSSIERDRLVEIGSRHLECQTRAVAGRTDLRTSTGSVRGSVAERDGWRCLYVGHAPESVVDSWLSMRPEESLAEDTALAELRRPRGQITVLVPSNLIQFVSVLPIHRWLSSWNSIKEAMNSVRPSALRIDIDLSPYAVLEVRMARADGSVTRLRVELEDTEYGIEELLPMLRLVSESVSS